MSKFGIITIIFLLAAVAGSVAVIMLQASVAWLIGLTVIYLSILFYGVVTPSAAFFIPVKWRGDRSGDAIAITFDDGPQAGHTDKVMDVLARHNVQAAFFCIGNNVLRHPDLARQLHDAGHLVSNHSFTHSSTFDLQSAGIME
ncbi:MAG: polysaccharide deacetylase family protein, partial [Bacteroidia bacterium]|nr:polysaccharide deacetylase family protein [Bacteroidia bacterium]